MPQALQMGHIDDVIIRPATLDDNVDIKKLGEAAGPGMTIPKDVNIAIDRINESIASFSGKYNTQAESYRRKFWLVAEDLRYQRVVGMATINANSNYFPAYIKQNGDLRSSHHLSGRTEIGGLYVLEDFRDYRSEVEGKILKLGRALSLSRFMLMAARPKWFKDLVFAEIRGDQPTPGNNTFYNRVWRKQLRKNFSDADAEVVAIGHRHLSEHHRIYDADDLDFASWSDRDTASVGKPHKESIKAARILEGQGFAHYDDSCDIIGGGPHYACKLVDIAAVQNTKPLEALTKAQLRSDDIFAVSNGVPSDFRIAFMNGVSSEGMQRCKPLIASASGQYAPAYLCLDNGHSGPA